MWVDVLFFLIFLEMLFILFWTLFSLPPKNRGRKLSTKGIYSFIRHPIYTVVIFHTNILTSLWAGSYLLLFLVPIQYLLWSKMVVKEEEYLIGIFGQEYIDYMSNVSRFIPWKQLNLKGEKMKKLILTLLFMGAVMSQEKFYGFEFVKELSLIHI